MYEEKAGIHFLQAVLLSIFWLTVLVGLWLRSHRTLAAIVGIFVLVSLFEVIVRIVDWVSCKVRERKRGRERDAS